MYAKITAVAIALSVLTPQGFAQDTMTSASMNGMNDMAGMASHDPEMHQAMMKMDKDMMGAPMTGDPDKDFATMMIPHHQGAIDMARIYLKKAKDPKFRKMAENIVESQEKEIKEMKDHLADLQNASGKSSPAVTNHTQH